MIDIGAALVPTLPLLELSTTVPADRLIPAPARMPLPALLAAVRKNVPALPAWLAPAKVTLPVELSFMNTLPVVDAVRGRSIRAHVLTGGADAATARGHSQCAGRCAHARRLGDRSRSVGAEGDACSSAQVAVYRDTAIVGGCQIDVVSKQVIRWWTSS